MPQMSPLNWLTLNILFIFIYMIFNMKNYFHLSYNPMMQYQPKGKTLKLNWKW